MIMEKIMIFLLLENLIDTIRKNEYLKKTAKYITYEF